MKCIVLFVLIALSMANEFKKKEIVQIKVHVHPIPLPEPILLKRETVEINNKIEDYTEGMVNWNKIKDCIKEENNDYKELHDLIKNKSYTIAYFKIVNLIKDGSIQLINCLK